MNYYFPQILKLPDDPYWQSCVSNSGLEKFKNVKNYKRACSIIRQVRKKIVKNIVCFLLYSLLKNENSLFVKTNTFVTLNHQNIHGLRNFCFDC